MNKEIKEAHYECVECEKPFEPDQYYVWCNRCGEIIERQMMERKKMLKRHRKELSKFLT